MRSGFVSLALSATQVASAALLVVIGCLSLVFRRSPQKKRQPGFVLILLRRL